MYSAGGGTGQGWSHVQSPCNFELSMRTVIKKKKAFASIVMQADIFCQIDSKSSCSVINGFAIKLEH